MQHRPAQAATGHARVAAPHRSASRTRECYTMYIIGRCDRNPLALLGLRRIALGQHGRRTGLSVRDNGPVGADMVHVLGRYGAFRAV